MSKKSRRFRTPNLPPEAYAAVHAAGASAEAPNAVSASSTPIAVAAPAEVALDLMGEYKDVLSDLRKTFIIFLSMVVVMLALSFVI